MKKLFILLAALLLGGSIGTVYLLLDNFHIEEKRGSTLISTENIRVSVPAGYLTKKEVLIFSIRAEKAYRDIVKYMGEENAAATEPSKLYLAEGSFISHANGKFIKLSYVKEGRSPYLHELVHTLTDSSLKRRRWMREGLAIYLNDYLGGSSTFPNYGEDIDGLAREYMEDPEYSHILTLEDRYWSNVSVEERRAFYLYSGSLTKYIIETYGRDYYMDIFNGERLDFIEGEQGERIVKEWIGKINQAGV